MDVTRRAQHAGQPVGRVPPIDLGATYADLKPEIDAAVTRVLASGRFIGGPEVEGLESEFAAFCGVPHAVSVASGTDALRFALLAAGFPPADSRRNEVITSPLSFAATTEAISQAGGRPVFVDVDPESLTIDPALVRKALSPKTAAIIPVHLYGQVADMAPLLEMARDRGVPLVEDACQAHGAQYRGSGAGRAGAGPGAGGGRGAGDRGAGGAVGGGAGGAAAGGAAAGTAAGALGDAGCFSFYPTKNLGGCGEGGMLTTRSPEIAARVKRLRDHGQSEKYIHVEEGYNGRLDSLQAAILRVKLKRLSGWNARRRALAALYSERLKEMGLAADGTGEAAEGPGRSSRPLLLPVEKSWGVHVYHLYTVRFVSAAGTSGPSPRDRARAALAGMGIDTGIHYPIPLHLQPCHAGMRLGAGSFPVAERAAGQVLSLPLFPEMSEAQVERVCEGLREVLGAP